MGFVRRFVRRPDLIYLEDSQQLNRVNWYLSLWLDSIPFETGDIGDWEFGDCCNCRLQIGENKLVFPSSVSENIERKCLRN